ncbi:putative pheophorbide a oxygenase [Helianthus debilis subsp. tardiflorus]
MCSMAMGFSIAAAAATTTNIRFFTPLPIRLRRTTPLISPLHTSPLSLFHWKKLPSRVASTTNVETEQFDAQRDFWYAVTLIKDLDPNIRTSFTIALYGRITVIQLLKENGQWIAFKENSVHCPFGWPVQGCSRCSSRSSDGRAAQSPRACGTRFPTLESEGVLYVRQRVRFTQLPSDKPIDTMPEVPANDHREDSPNEKSTTPCSPCRTTSSDLKSTKEDSMNEKPRPFVSHIVKGALQIFVENMAEF